MSSKDRSLSIKRRKKGGRKKKVVVPIRKRGRGRPELGWPTYEEAKVLVRARGIKSMTEYKDWYKRERIKFLPGYPYRVYVKEWVSWGEFLGSSNEFYGTMEKRVYRPYWEAVRWVQGSDIGSWSEWKVAYREGRVPSDIPKWPYVHYPEFSAEVWFGKSLAVKMDVVERQQLLWVLVKMDGDGEGVVWFLKVGRGEMERGRKNGWKVLKAWEYEEGMVDEAWKVIEQYSSEHWEKEQRLCSNVAQMMFALDSKLLMVKV